MEAQELLGKKTAYDVETTYQSQGAVAARDLLRKEFTDLKDPTAIKAMVDKLSKDTSSSQILHAISLEAVDPTVMAGSTQECLPVRATKDKLKEVAGSVATTGDEAFNKLMAQNILDQYDALMGPPSPYNPKFGHDARSGFGCSPNGITQPDIESLKEQGQFESLRTSTAPIPVETGEAAPAETTPTQAPETVGDKPGSNNQGPELVGTTPAPGNQGPELVGTTPSPGNQGPELVGTTPSPGNQGPELVGTTPSPGNQGPELVGTTPAPGNQGPELVGTTPSPGNQGPELVGKEPGQDTTRSEARTDKQIDVMAGAGYWDVAADSLGYTKGAPTKSIADIRAYVNSHTSQKDKTRIFNLMQQLQKDNHKKVLHPHEKLTVTAQEIEQSEK